MNKYSALVFMCILASFALAQDSTQPSKEVLIKEFARTAKVKDVTLSFVLLNNRTVDFLFAAPGKYAMRARANMATVFYVQGTPEKDVKVDTKYIVEQDGTTFEGTVLNIKNFVEGETVAKGTRIDGIIQLEKKLDLTHPFKIKGANVLVDFALTPEALKMMGN